MSLAGDGLNDELYYLLWAKSEAATRSHRKRNDLFRGECGRHQTRQGTQVPWYLPQTVVYKASSPCAWYFTSVKTGEILKKSKHNLLSRRIEEEFTKQSQSGDIVAYYLTLPNAFREDEDPPIPVQSPRVLPTSTDAPTSASSSTTPGHDDDARIEYFDRAGLHRFLFNRSKDCGLLQKFIEPQGPRNAVIRAIWSPKLCIAERRVTIRSLDDRRYGLFERAVTYEGADHHSQATPLKSHALSTLIQNVCKQLVDHVALVTFPKQQIARAVFNFKVDAHGRLYFLWSSSIRLEDASIGPVAAASPPSSLLGQPQGAKPCSVRRERRRDAPERQRGGPQRDQRRQPMKQNLVQEGRKGRVQRRGDARPRSSSGSPLPTPTDADDDRLLDLRAHVRLPSDVHLLEKAAYHPTDPEAFPSPVFTRRCPSCHSLVHPDRLHPVTYQMVAWLHDKAEKRARRTQTPGEEKGQRNGGTQGVEKSDSGRDNKRIGESAAQPEGAPHTIPPLLLALHPELGNAGVDAYQRWKEDTAFAQERVDVCENCFVRHADVACEAIARRARVLPSVAPPRSLAQSQNWPIKDGKVAFKVKIQP